MKIYLGSNKMSERNFIISFYKKSSLTCFYKLSFIPASREPDRILNSIICVKQNNEFFKYPVQI